MAMIYRVIDAVRFLAVQGLCNGRVSVRPPASLSVRLSVCPVDSSRFSIHICRRHHSAEASGQRQRRDPKEDRRRPVQIKLI